MPNRWGKVGKVVLFFVVILISGVGIGFGVYFRVTNIGETLRHAPEVARKAKEYGMYTTRSDFENGIRDLPKGYKMPGLDQAVERFGKSMTKHKISFSANVTTRTGKRPIAKSDLPKLREALKQIKVSLETMIASPNPQQNDSWKMQQFFSSQEYEPWPNTENVQEAILINAWEEAVSGNFSKAIDDIRFEAKMRRYIAQNDRTVVGAEHAIETAKMAAFVYLRMLQELKSPPINLIQEIQAGLKTPIPFDYQHYARVCFYLGGDWFPDGRTVAELAEDEGKFLRFHPSIVKAWKLHIQLAAIRAYEAGAKESNELDALEASMTVFNEQVYEGALYDTSRWAYRDYSFGGLYMRENLREAPNKLRDLIKALSKPH